MTKTKTLVVVESPSKAKKIGAMLGDNFVVQASGGHIRDLPVRPGDFGYDKDTLDPVYEITERGIDSVKYLKSKLALCGTVLLATDPDREGEAIGWHVAEVLGIKNRQRVKFHEITATAIAAAIGAPTPLDTRLVRAQEARRVVDRMVGWLVSGQLSKSIDEKASAGRVQSPSLALVVEREREIKGFVKEQSFGAKLKFDNWVAEWQPKEKCTLRGEAEHAASSLSFTVAEYIERDETEAPPAPFDTALLQQAASVALKIDPEQTMRIAQKLFEAGLITYHRTDEANISDEAFSMIVEYANQNGLPVLPNRRKFKAAAGAQEAHEAIRPAHFDADVSALSGEELALYTLILRRAVASQLSDVVYSVRRVKLDSDGAIFAAVGRWLKDKGWRGFGVAAEVEDEEAVATNPVPVLEVGATLVATDSKVIDAWTRAPGRYTKASLIKKLKELGIGRPATYATAVDGLEKKAYVSIEKRNLVPTPLADKIYVALKGKFSFIETGYTKTLEEDLDAITQGTKTYDEVVRGVQTTLHHELAALGLSPAAKRDPKPHAVGANGKAVKCPKCDKPMVVRTSAKGQFYGCTGYPDCKGTQKI